MAWYDSPQEQGFKDGQKSGDADEAAVNDLIAAVVPGTQEYAEGFNSGVESTKK